MAEVDDATAATSQPRSRRSDPSSDRRSRASQETGESSTAAAQSSRTVRTSTDDGTDTKLDPGSSPRGKRNHFRQHKHRSSGAFLLHDAFEDPAAEPDHNHRRKQYRQSLQPQPLKGKSAARMADISRLGGDRTVGLGIEQAANAKAGSLSPEQAVRATSSITVAKRPASRDTTAIKSLPARATEQPLDVESTQIVNMALNLSESRRIASRRNISQTVPPRLAPLPDTAVGGSLRQHLQQQRRVSRTGSPRPDRAGTPRLPSGQRVTNGLPGLPDTLYDGSYRYHFTPSTLARAQKAKEQLELMAQYRRLLELVPPVKPSHRLRSAANSPPSTPLAIDKVPTFGSADTFVQLGRSYNPLQYIRNRKVRARERKAVDGETQGFGDVAKVTEWVDQTARWAATGQAAMPGGTALPPYADADLVAQQSASDTTVTRPKRPRVDWHVDPASLLADAYWLEQDQNKQLIEDRHWRRIFPQMAETYQPLGRSTQDPLLGSPQQSRQESGEQELAEEEKSTIPALAKIDTEHSHSSARDRARQKLHDLKGGFHHRHNTSVHSHHEFARHRHGSISDVSDSDNDLKERRVRSGTITSNSKDLLEKQMMEMIAREARESEIQQSHQRFVGTTPLTPERTRGDAIKTPSRPPSRLTRPDSVANASESDEKLKEIKPQSTNRRTRVGRESLDIPGKQRFSNDVQESAPTSPDLRPIRASGLLPAIGMDLTPPASRANSPTRKGLTKVKQIFRERSRERNNAGSAEPKDDNAEHAIHRQRTLSEGPETSQERRLSPERLQPLSPATSNKLATRGTGDSHKSHRSMGSLRLRGDDQGGVRGLFKGARIDTVIRGGVSKLGDFIWRRDANAADALSEGTTTDESGDEQARGRRRNSLMLSRTGSRRGTGREEQYRPSTKNFLDVMPAFHSTLDANGERQPLEDGASFSPASGASPTPSRKPSRFELLRPPRIDVRAASPTSLSPPPVEPQKQRQHQQQQHGGHRVPSGSELSDSDSYSRSRPGSYVDRVRTADARLNSIIAIPPSFMAAVGKGRNASVASSRREQQRHWSVSTDRRTSLATEAGFKSAPLSRREVARLRALILSSGVKAMEIARRAHEPRTIFAGQDLVGPVACLTGLDTGAVSWTEVADLSTDPAALRARAVPPAELYPLAARALGGAIQATSLTWQAKTDAFARETAPRLERKVDAARTRVAADLIGYARSAADEADETSRDLALSQRLEIKRVVDVMDKMLRRRRRRFRWVRRAMWLAVEWVLVGIMWYVWFVVVLLRVVFGIGRGVLRGVRWLLWL